MEHEECTVRPKGIWMIDSKFAYKGTPGLNWRCTGCGKEEEGKS